MLKTYLWQIGTQQLPNILNTCANKFNQLGGGMRDNNHNIQEAPPEHTHIKIDPIKVESTWTDFFKDDVGEYSSMRLLTFVGTIAFFTMWVYGCIIEQRFVHFTYEDMLTILGLVGVKALQSNIENKSTANYMNRSTGNKAVTQQQTQPTTGLKTKYSSED